MPVYSAAVKPIAEAASWLTVVRGEAPLLLTIPHSGTDIPANVETHLRSPWLARKDTDWYVHQLYDFARELDVTVIRTALSRTAIDVNRDPSGRSLYPGRPTTELCPTTTFDAEPLYRDQPPDADEIAARRVHWFEPFHRAITEEIARLKRRCPAVVLYDAHSIRSVVPRLFAGTLPHFNIGTNDGASCARELAEAVEAECATSTLSSVTNGRFKGGYATRHYGAPRDGIHAIQMELACRGYLREPFDGYTAANWPPPYDESSAAPLRRVLVEILKTCLRFAAKQHHGQTERPP
jgi:N-formylglutamate deformylase